MFIYFLASTFYLMMLYAIYKDFWHYRVTRDPFGNEIVIPGDIHYAPTYMMIISDEEESEDDESPHPPRQSPIKNLDTIETPDLEHQNENNDEDEGSYDEPDEEEYRAIVMAEKELANGSASEEDDEDEVSDIPPVTPTSQHKSKKPSFRQIFSSFSERYLSTQSEPIHQHEMDTISSEFVPNDDFTLIHIRKENDTKSL